MTDRLLALPPHLRRQVAGALSSGSLSPPYTAALLHSALGARDHVEDVLGVLAELEAAGVTGPAAALFFRAVDEVSARAPRADIVWSGHAVRGLSGRDTREVFRELFGKARRSLWVSTFVVYQGAQAFGGLARRMAATPGLRVTLLLNVGRVWGDDRAADHIVREFADGFWAEQWPEASRPRVYYDPRALEPGRGKRSSFHAKAVVVDDEEVFVTSANVTEAAQERNVELGLLVRDGPIAASVSGYFQALIDRELLRPLPRS